MKQQKTNQKMIIAALAAIADFRKIAEAEAATTGFVPFDWEPDWIAADGTRVPWWEVEAARQRGETPMPARDVLDLFLCREAAQEARQKRR